MIVVIVVVMVLAFAGAIAYGVKSKRESSAEAEAAGTGPNEFLQAPPTSFPGSVVTAPPASAESEPEPEPASEPAADPVADPVEPMSEPVAPVEDAADPDDERTVSRFRSPGSRSTADPDLLKPMAAARPVFHLEAEPGPEPIAVAVPELELELELVEPEIEIEPEPEPEAEPEPELVELIELAQPEPETIIDLVDAPAPADDGGEPEWNDVVLDAEPDSVDHVLQALITRARFKQVGVEEVATELVERADLRGEDVSEVLAELVGRADTVIDVTALENTPTSELTLFNDNVPSRPGQLTDFARLAPADKKRIIIRVLCLLVARSEDQQLPPRAEVDGATPKSWPLARAVWPLATDGDDDADLQLPSRRLAKSG